MYSAVVQQVVQSPGQAPGTISVWEMVGVVAGAGAFGGLINALLSSSSGFSIQWPQKGKGDILQLGALGNVLLGIFAALITWGLYGTLKDAVLLGPVPTGQLSGNLTITAWVGAALAGAGGARVISAEIDKRFLRSAAAEAAQQPASTPLALAIATLPPVKALAAANDQAASNQATADQATADQAAADQAAGDRAAGSLTQPAATAG